MRCLSIIYLFLALSLVGCTTSYKDAVSVTQLSEKVYRIESKGNSYTDRARVHNYALLKASEMCLEKGFTGFVVVDQQERKNQESINLPSTSRSTTNCYEGGMGFHCNTASTGGWSMPRTVTTHGYKLEIRYLGKTEARPSVVYDCNIIAGQLASYDDTKKKEE